MRFYDKTRERPVVTEVWYPTADTVKSSDNIASPFIRALTVRDAVLPPEKLPLILMSHGTGGGRLTMEWLAQGLVRNGFIVAAVDHYGNTYDNPIPLEFIKPWNRPLDISFALTQLIHDDGFSRIIDTALIGALGFSYGGYTVIALAGAKLDFEKVLEYYRGPGRNNLRIPEQPDQAVYIDDSSLDSEVAAVPDLKENRIKAFFSISPSMGVNFTEPDQVDRIKKPLFIVGSHSDTISPVSANAYHYHRLIPHSRYYEFPGQTGHYVMLNEASDDLKKSVPIYFNDPPSVNRKQIHANVISLSSAFFIMNLGGITTGHANAASGNIATDTSRNNMHH